MKGSNRNKDHSAEGEGAGKRPKRKCLQWHPLLAKKLLDFSEEEEEEDEEEDIDKAIPLFIINVLSLSIYPRNFSECLWYERCISKSLWNVNPI